TYKASSALTVLSVDLYNNNLIILTKTIIYKNMEGGIIEQSDR
ncbi:9032_t:CDS:2, partial [Dentiscutata erythropus]